MNLKNLKFEFWKRLWKKKTTNMKIVGIEELWNFVADNVLVWNHLVMQNYAWILKFEFFKLSRMEKPPK
jgi:NADH/NAD ratio-sensing transcriptional regulator Rex